MANNIVILAAGVGSRLGRPHPKPLTPLSDGRGRFSTVAYACSPLDSAATPSMSWSASRRK